MEEPIQKNDCVDIQYLKDKEKEKDTHSLQNQNKHKNEHHDLDPHNPWNVEDLDRVKHQQEKNDQSIYFERKTHSVFSSFYYDSDIKIGSFWKKKKKSKRTCIQIVTFLKIHRNKIKICIYYGVLWNLWILKILFCFSINDEKNI